MAGLAWGAATFSQSGFFKVIRYSTTSVASCSESRRLGMLLSAKCFFGLRTQWKSQALFILLPTPTSVGANSSRKRLRVAALSFVSWKVASGVSVSLWQAMQPTERTRISPLIGSPFSVGGAGSAAPSDRLQTYFTIDATIVS